MLWRAGNPDIQTNYQKIEKYVQMKTLINYQDPDKKNRNYHDRRLLYPPLKTLCIVQTSSCLEPGTGTLRVQCRGAAPTQTWRLMPGTATVTKLQTTQEGRIWVRLRQQFKMQKLLGFNNTISWYKLQRAIILVDIVKMFVLSPIQLLQTRSSAGEKQLHNIGTKREWGQGENSQHILNAIKNTKVEE